MSSWLSIIIPSTLFVEVLAFESSNQSITPKSSYPQALHIRNQHCTQHSKFKSYDHSTQKIYWYCKRKEYLLNDCLKKQWSDTQAKGEEIENDDIEWNWEKKWRFFRGFLVSMRLPRLSQTRRLKRPAGDP